jgi:AAHS family 4-hydroxybenzoate transporter-like MFS transporter
LEPSADIGTLIDSARWSRLQKSVLAMAALAVVFDGFDNQLLGFAIPAMVRDWHVARSAFSIVVALGFVGMAFGSALAGRIGDIFGRRTALILSVVVFGAATSATAFADGVLALAILRFLAGAGIGGALPNATTISAEFTPLTRRSMAVILTIVCVPVGGMLGGVAAAWILPALGWRTLFGLGGAAPIVFAAVLWFAMPESPRFLSRRPERWPELRAMLARIGSPVAEGTRFIDVAEERLEAGTMWKMLLGPGLRNDTLFLWLCFFCSLLTVNMAFSWLPSLLASEGWGLAESSSGLAYYNFGGIFGAILCGAWISGSGSRRPMTWCALGAAGSAVAIGPAPSLPVAVLGLHGFFVNAVQASAFTLSNHIYTTRVRATGAAFALSVGRLGSLVAAFTGAPLVQAGRAAFLDFLALAMFGAFVALALIGNHIPARRSVASVINPIK